VTTAPARIMEDMSEEGQVGPWDLHEKLGEGGNATVWGATREGSEERCALKLIKATKANKEPYRRFVREIKTLRSLGDYDGVLPVIDAYLPEKPSKDDRPWLAMPIARPLSEALAEAPLETVVEAVAQIAETLAGLAAEHELAHRDLKPDNLYEFEGRWLVGDFGLVAVPDVEELTRAGRPLGPAHYTAYEMIVNPNTADPRPADVYSLGKTLWVLATGQHYPPEGHQPAGTRGFSIDELHPHAHADALDRLVDAMTLIHPEDRPSMEQVARDLRAWQTLNAEAPPVDLSQAGAQLREKLAGELVAGERRESNKEQAIATVRRLQELIAPLNRALTQLHPNTEIDVMDDKLTNNMLKTFGETGAREIEWRWTRCTRVPVGPEHHRYSLRMGRGLELTGDGALIFRALIDISYPSLGGSDFFWQSGEREAPVGTIEADRMLQDAVMEVEQQLEKAVAVFVDKAPGGS
jgi:serine/threonine protein kinase